MFTNYASSSFLLTNLFYLNIFTLIIFKIGPESLGSTPSKPSKAGGKSGGGGGAGSKAGHKRSVGSQFRESLNLLMTNLNSTNPHYIRLFLL